MVEVIPEDNLSTTSGVTTVAIVESFSYMYDELLTWKKPENRFALNGTFILHSEQMSPMDSQNVNKFSTNDTPILFGIYFPKIRLDLYCVLFRLWNK